MIKRFIVLVILFLSLMVYSVDASIAELDSTDKEPIVQELSFIKNAQDVQKFVKQFVMFKSSAPDNLFLSGDQKDTLQLGYLDSTSELCYPYAKRNDMGASVPLLNDRRIKDVRLWMRVATQEEITQMQEIRESAPDSEYAIPLKFIQDMVDGTFVRSKAPPLCFPPNFFLQ